MKTYRQGDVLLQRVTAMPKKLTKLPRIAGRLVLAAGKSTGHSHAVPTTRCDLFTAGPNAGEMFLQVRVVNAQLVHDEHTTIALPKGNYRVTRQREMTSGTIRRVED